MGAARVRGGAAALAALCACASAACILPRYEEAPASVAPLSALWSRRLGGVKDEHGLDVAIDAAGNVILVGRYQSRMSFDGEVNFVGPALSGDGFVAKYNDAGQSLFTVTFGDDLVAQEASSVAIDPSSQDVVFGGHFFGTAEIGELAPLTASMHGSALVARLDTGGNALWARVFTDLTGVWPVGTRDVAVDAQGDVLLVGHWCGTIDFSTGDAMPNAAGIVVDGNTLNGFVTKRDAKTGDFAWVARFDSGGPVIPTGVAVDASDNVLVTGFYEGDGYVTDTEGMSVALGPNALGRDLFVVELDSDGRYLWSVGVGEPGAQEGTGIAVDAGGNALVSGFSALSVEGEITPAGFHAIALKVDRTGFVEWEVGLPGLDLDATFDVVADAAGDVLLTGRRTSLVRFRLQQPDDVLIALLDGADGTVRTTMTYGGEGAQYGAGIALDGDDNVVIAGAFQEELDFGGGVLMSKGENDIFVTKLQHP